MRHFLVHSCALAVLCNFVMADILTGTVVRVTGLVNAAHLNGLAGKVTRYLRDKSRYEVDLDQEHGQEHGVKLIRRVNLDVVTPSQQALPKGSKKVVSERSCGYIACRMPGASLTCAQCKGVSYCCRAHQKQHWSKQGGNHKEHCRPAPKPGQPLHSMPVTVTPGCGSDGDDTGDECTICLSAEGGVIQRGCGCRGDSGWVHVACMVELAHHATTHDDLSGGSKCGTCKRNFTGALQLGLARALQVQVKSPVGNGGTEEIVDRIVRRLHAVELLGKSLAAGGKHAEAEAVLLEGLMLEKVVSSRDEPVTGMASQLAIIYNEQGRYNEAEALNLEVLAVKKRVLGDDHIGTLQTSSNLALTYRYQGKLAEAEALQVTVLAALMRTVGEDNPCRLIAADNLANTYSELGKHAKAEALQLAALAVQTRVHGSEHPDTLIQASNLASTHMRLGKFADAESRLLRLLVVQKRVLGVGNPHTLGTTHNLSVAFSEQGKYAQAEATYLELIAVQKQVLGVEHPQTLRTTGNLASTYHAQGMFARAEGILRTVLAAQKRALGDRHPQTLRTASNLVDTRRERAKRVSKAK